MRRAFVIAGVLCLLAASSAQAQFFGQLGPLNPRAAEGMEMMGAYLGLADSQWGLTGQLRMGLTPKMDAGLQAGFGSYDPSGTRFGARVDLKAHLLNLTEGNSPIAFGGNADLHFTAGEELTVFGFAVVPGVSLGGDVGSGQTVAGWAGFGIQVDFPDEGDSFNSALLRLGGEYDFTRQMGLVAEFNHLFANDGSDQFMVGLNVSLVGK